MLKREQTNAGGVSLTNVPFVGPVHHTSSLLIDLSNLSSAEVDSEGLIKPGVPLTKDGKLITRRPGLHQFYAAGGAAGDIVVTGITTADRLLSVTNLTDAVDVAGEFSITADDTINNSGGGTTAGDVLLVAYLVEDQYVFGVTIGVEDVAKGNTQALLDAAATSRSRLPASAWRRLPSLKTTSAAR